MIKIFLLLFSFSLFARENPFFPIDSALDISFTNQQIEKAPSLQRASLTLPSTAREIESVTITYKNLDGSLAKKSIELKNSIDWHLPIFISQNYNLASQSKRVSHKSKKFQKFASLGFITLFTAQNKMKIETKDRLLRSFFLIRPRRIVCDFKRVTNFGSYQKRAKGKNVFRKVTFGTHKGYYRVVIELDGTYKHRLKKDTQGYLLTLY